MKKVLLTLGLVGISTAVFAQGKIGFVNDSQHLFILGGAGLFLYGPDISLANQPLSGSVLPSGIHLVAGLYAGTSSTSMTLQTSSTQILEGSVVPQPGRMASKSVVLNGISGGTPAFFQVWVWDNTFSTPLLSGYVGQSSIFTATPGTSITYPPIAPQGGAASSTWSPEDIHIGLIPEPSTSALAFLCGLAIFLFRRQKINA